MTQKWFQQDGATPNTAQRVLEWLRKTYTVQETGRLEDRPPLQDRAVRQTHLRNRHRTLCETANNTLGSHGHHIHADTVRNRLLVYGLRARRPYVGLTLIGPRSARRRAWLPAHSPENFLMRQLRLVLFTD